MNLGKKPSKVHRVFGLIKDCLNTLRKDDPDLEKIEDQLINLNAKCDELVMFVDETFTIAKNYKVLLKEVRQERNKLEHEKLELKRELAECQQKLRLLK